MQQVANTVSPAMTDSFWKMPALPAPFRVAFTTKAGGISTAPYSSLNLALHVGDSPRCVRDNRERVFNALELDASQAVVAQQIHEAYAAVVSLDDAGRGSFSHADTIEGADALVTKEHGLPLVCFNADCLLLALGDPQSGVLGVVHAGWRGMAAGVIENTVALMKEFGADPARIHAVGSPSIGPCCFEVGDEVVQALGAEHVQSRHGDKAMFDFRSAARARLGTVGIASERVQIVNACTCCSTESFFSHRRATRDGSNRTGRMALIAWIAE